MGNKTGMETLVSGGAPLRLADLEVIPRSQAVIARGKHAGWVWNRPSHLVVIRDGELQRIPIPDRTRQIQILLWAAGLVFLLAGLFISRKE